VDVQPARDPQGSFFAMSTNTVRCCNCSVERHAYNGCADCSCGVPWTQHVDRDRDHSIEATFSRLAVVVLEKVKKFNDRKLNDGDRFWHAEEFKYRETVAAMAESLCETFKFHRPTFALSCGLYVSEGRDNYSDCRPGELTWEKPRA